VRRFMERRPLLFVPVRRIRDAVSLRRRHPEARRFRSTRREIILDRLNRWHKRDVNTGKFVRFTQRERRVFLLSSSPLRPPLLKKGGRR
jgi:hypothetical protein